ncbi:MAG TPA: PAS domain S-box protein, partial [Spirochaetota bacterium]|nr:PAS domain S-box protein [Spirochaetota bacterium]
MYERIVLVTDNQILSETLTGILQKADFTSIEYINESEISENTASYASALFIIDNNSQITPKILQQLDYLIPGHLKPYLLLVDTDNPNNIEQFLSCNPIAFISKPVNPPLLIVSVKNALSQINGYLLLHESEEKYRTIVETSMEGILIIDNNFHFEYVNPAFSTMIGVPCDKLIGQDFRLFLSDESKELVINNYKKRQQHEAAPSQYEFFLKRPDGTKRCVKIISTVIQNTKWRSQTVAILLDITEQIMAREDLLKSEERYQRLVESANEAILVAQNS